MAFFPLLKKRIITGLIPVLFPLAAYAECLPDGIYKISHVTYGNTATIFTDISEEEGSQLCRFIVLLPFAVLQPAE